MAFKKILLVGDATTEVEAEDTLLLSGNVSVAKSFNLSGDISPTQITANTNNYDPTGLSDASTLRISTDASRDLTGIVPKSPDDGRVLIIHNIGSFDLVLIDASANSTDVNRFALSGDITLAGDDAVTLQYDTTTNRWRAIGSSPGGAGGGGDVATDAIWDVKGDLAGGTGADTAVKLAVGTNDQVLTAASGETTGMKWAAAGNANVTFSVTIVNPVVSNYAIHHFFSAVTMQELQGAIVGGTSVTFDPYPSNPSRIGTSDGDLFSTPQVQTTTDTNYTSFNDATIIGDSWFLLNITAVSGNVSEFNIVFRFTYD